MSMQALLIRATFMAMLVIGLTVALIHAHSIKHSNDPKPDYTPKVAQSSIVQARDSGSHAIMLSTNIVRSNVTSRTHAANASHAAESATRIVESEQRKMYATLRPSLPKLRMDMPYYSFGKSTQRATRE
ncbi:MAG TPA: hypothetical protein VFN13_00460 [Rudaea sp.]|nr:hypothetical protein [Rudaea sp.]